MVAARHEEPVEVLVLVDEAEVGVDAGGDEAAPGRVFGERLAHVLHDAGQGPVDHGQAEPGPVAEVAVEDGFGDARLRRDGLHRGVGPVAPDGAQGRFHQLSAAGLPPRRRGRR